MWEGRRDGLSRERIFALLAEARALGAESFTPFGAEIFMRKDTPAILQEAARLGYRRINITTNGMLIARHAMTLADLPGLNLTVSIDGPEPVHDALRGAGKYRAAMIGVRAVLARRIPVGLQGLIMRPTLAGAAHLIDLAEQFDLSGVAYQPFLPDLAETRPDHAQWLFTPEERGEVAQALDALLDKARQAGVPVRTEVLFPWMERYLATGDRPVPPGGCGLPARVMVVDGHGETHPCHYLRDRSMGNVAGDVALAEVWESSLRQCMQARARAGDCPGCLSVHSDIGAFVAAGPGPDAAAPLCRACAAEVDAMALDPAR